MSDTLERLRERIDLQDCCDHETVLIPFSQARALLDIVEAAQAVQKARELDVSSMAGWKAFVLVLDNQAAALAALDSTGGANNG